jgi:hypothetical protein
MARGDGYRVGSEHPLAKLSESVVAFCRQSDRPTGELARRFNVCKKTLRAARRGDTWRHVEGVHSIPSTNPLQAWARSGSQSLG